MRATRSAKLLAVCAAALFLAFGCGGTDDNETAANPDTAAAAGPMTCAEHEQLTDDITERSARLGLEAGAGDKTEDEWMPELIGLMAENAANTEAAHRDGLIRTGFRAGSKDWSEYGIYGHRCGAGGDVSSVFG